MTVTCVSIFWRDIVMSLWFTISFPLGMLLQNCFVIYIINYYKRYYLIKLSIVQPFHVLIIILET